MIISARCASIPDYTFYHIVAGKSTLLQILAGKRLVNAEGADIRVLGRDVFRDSPPNITFLGTEWLVLLSVESIHLHTSRCCQGYESRSTRRYTCLCILGFGRRISIQRAQRPSPRHPGHRS